MSARSVGPSGCAGPRSGPSAVPTVQCPFASLVALITRRGLLFCAKHLFVAAIGGSSEARQARGGGEHFPVAARLPRRRRPRQPADVSQRRDDRRLARLGGDGNRGRPAGGKGDGAAQRFSRGARPGPGAAVRLLVNVSFDPLRGYVGTAPEMRAAVTAMSLNGLQGPSVPENRSPEHTLRRYLSGFCGAASGDEQMFGAE